ncbi:hypothetical protein GWP85_04235 [Acinetobacter beijerinckii]|uniref:hypothetical protein n=1 Tax=Acinetobacter beijerinckii TaxID=262668 RepID=UPI0023DDA52F|nr:hypothetical protein [Acinetobacter beijerinckii]MDF2416727.1 hypothetical protein [Acinetobacter beijerinckii]
MTSSSKLILMIFGIVMLMVFFKSTFVYEDYIKNGKREFQVPYVVKINDHGVDIYITEEQNKIKNIYYLLSNILIGSWLILFYFLKNRNSVEVENKDKKEE